MITMTFKVKSFTPIPCPFGFDKETHSSIAKFYGDNKQQCTYFALCHVKDLPDNIPMDTNPREQNLNTNVAKQIRDGLIMNRQQIFHLLNRGLLISADSISFNDETSELTMTFTDEETHGDIDGGHTYKIIKKHRDQLDFDQYVRLEIMTGIEDFFDELAAARNTSVQVQDKSLAELAGRFDFIKDALKDCAFFDEIFYKENEEGSIDIREIIAILTIFCTKKHGPSQQPTRAYSSKATCLRNFINDDSEFRKLVPIAPDIFALYNEIEQNMSDFYSGHYGKIKGIGYKGGEQFHHLRFSGGKYTAYETPMGFIYPILASFRCLVEENPENGMYRWRKGVNVFEMLEEIGPELANATVERSRTLGNNPQAVGKDTGHWGAMYDKVKSHYLEKLIGTL